VVAGAVSAAREGRPAAVFITGEPGLGKTAVLEQAALSATGLRLVHSRGEGSQAVLPFGFLDPLMREAGLADQPSRALDVPAAERATALWYRLRDWLAGRADPLILLLDDLHWADADSLTLIRMIIEHPRPGGLAVIASLRPHPREARQTADRLAAAHHARLVSLSPLSPAAATRLAARLTGQPSGSPLVTRIAQVCAGNPLLIHELAGHLDLSSATGEELPSGAGQWLLLSRFTGLDEATLDYARAAAVLGVEFRPAQAGSLAGLDDQAVTAALAALCGAGLVRAGAGDGLAVFTHALLHQALLEDLPPPLRGQLHAAAFRLLWSSGAWAATAAEHAVAAGLEGDPDAVAAAEQAGLDAQARGALDAAARWFTTAARLAGQRAEPALRLRLAAALHAAAAPEQALAACRSLLAVPGLDLATAITARRLLGRLWSELGDGEAAGRIFDEAASAAAGPFPELAIETLLEASLLALYTCGPARSLAYANRARALTGPGTSRQLAAWVAAARGNARQIGGDPGGQREVTRALALLPPGEGLRGLHGSVAWGPRLIALQSAKLAERFDDALAAYDLAVSEAAQAPAPLAMSIYTVAHADTLTRLGRLGEALALLEASVADTPPWLAARLPWALAGLAHLRYELDEPSAAAALCARIEQLAGAGPGTVPLLRFWLWQVRANLAADQGDLDTACALMSRAETLARASGTLDPNTVPWHATAIRVYLAAGRLADAGRVVARLEAACRRVRWRYPRAVAHRGRALLADRARRPAEAEREFQASLSWHAGLAMPLAHAETLLAQADFLRRAGSPASARQVAAEAVRIAERCGARRLARLATEALHLAGGRRRAGGSEGLTPVQEKVARLAAEGLTNAEIGYRLAISPRTVEHHLTRIYAVLGVVSRRQVRRTLASR
jgi:DNA-binding CsgD family transcriptional regulator